MTELKLLIKLKYDEDLMHSDDEKAREWFFKDILSKDSSLLLHSNEIGDTIGEVEVISINPNISK